MLRSTFLVALILCCFLWEYSEAQQTMSMDKGLHYIVAFPPVTAQQSEKPLNPAMSLLITAFDTTTVRIKSFNDSAAVIDKTEVLRPPTAGGVAVISVAIPTTHMVKYPQLRLNQVFEITANRPIAVNTRQSWLGNGEESSWMPVNTWGKDARVMSWPTDRYGSSGGGYKYRPGFFMIIASEDNTTVTIIPTVDTQGSSQNPTIKANQSGYITLDRNQVYLVQNVIDTALLHDSRSDLSGSRVTSTKPIAVLSGHCKGSVISMPSVLPPSGVSAAEAHFVRNNIHEQVIPSEFAGTEFAVIPTMYTPARMLGGPLPQFNMPNDSGDVVRIMALENETIVYEVDSTTGEQVKVARLQAGQYYTDSVVYKATVYTATKGVIVSQYGKSYAMVLPPSVEKSSDEVQGHPTVNSGMPTLATVPGTNQWITSAGFHADDQMDNFLNCVFRSIDETYLTVDGRSIAESNYLVKQIPNTPYSYFRTAISVGPHYIESSNEDVRFMAWYCASLDGLQQERAFGRALGVNATFQGADTIIVADEILPVADTNCGTTAAVVSVNGTTGLSLIYARQSSNYTLAVDTFEVGAMDGRFVVSVVDKSKPASISVRIAARSGAFLDKTYTYIPTQLQNLNEATEVISSPRATTCIDVMLKNTNSVPVEVKGFVTGLNAVTVSTNSQLPVVLEPGAEQSFQVCMRADVLMEGPCELFASLNCFDDAIDTFNLSVEKAYLTTTDAIFGSVPPNTTPSKKVEISNPANSPLLVDGLDLSMIDSEDYFSIDTASLPDFPVLLSPSQKLTFDVVFTPNNDTIPRNTVISVHSNSVSPDSTIICSANGSWTVRVNERENSISDSKPNPVSLNGLCTVTVPFNAIINIVDVRGRVIAEIATMESSELAIRPRSMGMNVGVYYIVRADAKANVISKIIVEP